MQSRFEQRHGEHNRNMYGPSAHTRARMCACVLACVRVRVPMICTRTCVCVGGRTLGHAQVLVRHTHGYVYCMDMIGEDTLLSARNACANVAVSVSMSVSVCV